MPRIRKKTSKRGTTNQRARIKRKVTESHRKAKKAAKKNVQWKSKQKKDPGIPNNFPYKDQILAEVAEERRKAAEEKQRRKEEKQAALVAATEAATAGGDSDDEPVAFDGVRSIRQANAGTSKTLRPPQPSLNDDQEPPILIDHTLPNLSAVLDIADIVIQVLDAREPLASRSSHLEAAISRKPDVKSLLILNKIDLAPRESVSSWLQILRSEHPTIPIRVASAFLPSAFEPAPFNPKGKAKATEPVDDAWGIDELVAFLHKTAAEVKKTEDDESLKVAFVGPTNSGKSSIINSILKRAALPVYSLHAFAANAAAQGPSTTSYAFSETISSPSRAIKLIDTPGYVLNTSESAQSDIIRAEDILLRNRGRIERLKDPLPPVARIVARASKDNQHLMLHYNLSAFTPGDVDGMLNGLARARNLLSKNASPDAVAAARVVLRDWNTGKFPWYTEPSTSVPTDSPADDVVLATLKTRKEMRRGAGLIRLEVRGIETREVDLDREWGQHGDSSDGDSDKEDEDEDEDVMDEDEETDEDEDEDDGGDDDEEEEEEEEEEETLIPILSNSKKRRQGSINDPLPIKKVARFAADPHPKESKQARRAASKRAPAEKPVRKLSSLAPSNYSSSNRLIANSAPSKKSKNSEDTYDFNQFFK